MEVLSTLDYANRTGFNPYAVDSIGNRVFGFTPINGRMALVAISLMAAKVRKSYSLTTRSTLIASCELAEIIASSALAMRWKNGKANILILNFPASRLRLRVLSE
jgi:hypothetical protein